MIDPKTIVAIFDDENKSTSTVVCQVPAGFDAKGQMMFRKTTHTLDRRSADQLAKVLRKQDKAASDLYDGKKPGSRKK